MRRHDRERREADFFEDVLRRAEILFVAFNGGEYPYCLPFNFARIGGRLCIHSARDGKKLELIRQNPHVGFSAAIDVEIAREKATTYYKSVSGEGKALIIEDAAEKGAALDALAEKYHARCQRPATPQAISHVAIWAIEIKSMTGKENCQD